MRLRRLRIGFSRRPSKPTQKPLGCQDLRAYPLVCSRRGKPDRDERMAREKREDRAANTPSRGIEAVHRSRIAVTGEFLSPFHPLGQKCQIVHVRAHLPIPKQDGLSLWRHAVPPRQELGDGKSIPIRVLSTCIGESQAMH